MVALLNTRIDQEELLPLLELCHPALLPVDGEALLIRNCAILEEYSVSHIYILVSQRPEELEEHIVKAKLSVPVEFIVQPEQKRLAGIVKELSPVLSEEEVIYVPSQLVLTREMAAAFVKNRTVSERTVLMGHLPYILDSVNFSPLAYPCVGQGEVLDSIQALYQINKSKALGKRQFNGVILEGVNIAAKSCKLSPGTSLHNTILLPGVITDRFEHLENVVVTDQATFNLETGRVIPRQNRDRKINPARIFDMFAAGLGLLFLAPLFLFVAILIKIDSKGPVFYKSSRAVSPERSRFGADKAMKEVPFTVFRTMYVNADQMVHSDELTNHYGTGPYKKFDNDCRITRIGHFLRKSSLDELPLLWHVFIGDLSLVGTWALPKYEAKAIDEVPLVINDIDFTEVGRARFEGTAGIAGLWQCGGRSDLPAEERAVLDAVQTAMESSNYHSSDMPNIRHSIKGYVGMILTTIRSVILCRGAQ